MHLSFWERESFFTGLDVVIIGSGIVGLNAALQLKKRSPSLKVLVLERGVLPLGASSRNAGFACFGSPGELLDDLEKYDEQEVLDLVEKRWKGLQRLRQNLGDSNIDFQNHGGYEVFTDDMSYLRCLEKIDYLNQKIGQVIGQKKVYQMADDRIAKFGLQKVKHMLVNTAEAQIDTGRMIRALLSKTRAGSTEILNGIEVLNISDEADNVLISCAGNISFSCKKLIVATNGFARQLLPLEDVEPARAQVLVTEPIPDLKLKGTFHFDGGYYYFRNIGNRVLLGGARNSDFHAEATMEFGLTENIQSRLEELLKTMILPSTEFKIDIRWSGIMGVGPQKKSIVRATSKNVYCAVRMGGMGVAIGSLIGEDVANLVADQL